MAWIHSIWEAIVTVDYLQRFEMSGWNRHAIGFEGRIIRVQ